jgi:predicted DNA-binding transcriptional regulator AlpA
VKQVKTKQDQGTKSDQQYLSDKLLSTRYKVSRATIWRWVREGTFPSPIKLTQGCTRWRSIDIFEWEAKQEGVA